MFGSSGFGSGGFGQNQNTQNTGGGFGTTGTGTTSTGGGFGTFGQPAQQQSTGFGSTGFGSAQPSSGFGTGGGFGQQSSFGQQQNKPFGAAAPTTTSSLFGGGGTATSGGGFGATGGGFGAGGTTTQSTGFGAPAAATGTGGLFGAKPAAAPGGFGSTSTGTSGLFGSGGSTTPSTGFGGSAAQPGFGAASNTALQVPQNGTASPQFEVYQEKDAASSMMNHFHTIAFQSAYQKASLEELRMQDYAQGRRFATGPTGFGGGVGGFGTGAFGQQQQQQPAQSTGFGQPATTSAGGLFGSGTATSTSGGGFGTTNSGGFGSTTPASTGLFGANKPATGGLFGSTPATTTTGGVFGSGTGTGFGTQTGTQGTGFGQSSTNGGLFGQQNAAQANKPTGFGTTGFGTTGTTSTGFGQQQTGGTAFGQASTTTPTGGGLFGQTQQQQPTTGGFGQPQQQQPATASPFGGGFGQQNQPQQQQQGTGFGTFGQQNQAQNKPAFGAGFGSTAPASNPPAGGLFGSTQAQSTTPQVGGGLFGQKAPFGTPTTSTGGGLFGNTQSTTPAAAPGGGLFGAGQQAQGAGGGLFGGQQQTQNTGGGMFGTQKPAGGGLFGSQPQAGGAATGGLFGSSVGGNPQGQTSLFGQNPAAQNPTGAFGGNQGGGLFGGAQSVLGSSVQANPMMLGNQPLNSSLIDQRPYGNIPLLDVSTISSNSPGPIATPLSTSTQKKKNAMIPHNKIAPRQPTLTPRMAQPFTRSISPFSASNGPAAGGSLGRSFGSSQARNTLGSSLFDASSDDSILSSAFSSPGTRSASLKKLVIDRKIRDTDLFSASSDVKAIKDGSSRDDGKALQNQGILKKTVSFDTTVAGSDSDRTERSSSAPAGETPSNALGFLRTPTKISTSESPASHDTRTQTPPIAESSTPENNGQIIATSTPEGSPVDKTPQEGEYWSVPSAAKLSTIPREQLKRVSEFTVGRRGYGQIRFDEPVDLTSLVSVDEIAGGLITFGTRVCTVYPPGWDKPPPGEGLNKPATITLENCYPTNREDKKPIKDTEHPRYHFHLKRLKNIKDTEFVDYLVQEGIWIFKVKHFTAYGLEDDDEDAPLTQPQSTSTSSRYQEQSFVSGEGDSSFVSEDATFSENPDDTFDFKRQQGRYHSSLNFDTDHEMDDSNLEADVTLEGQSFMESTQEMLHSSESEDEPTEILGPNDDSIAIMAEDGQPLTFADGNRLSPIRDGTPEPKLAVGRDWTEQLVQTISPVKNRRLHYAGDETPTRTGVAALGPLDFTGSFYGGGRVFESPLRAHMRTFSATLSSKKRGHADVGLTRPEPYNSTTEPSDDQAFHKCVRPTWGPNGEILYIGSIEGSRPRGFGDIRNSRLCNAKLKFSNSKPSAVTSQMDIFLAASTIELDQYRVPHAQLDKSLPFSHFAGISIDLGDAQQNYEKKVWQLASVLFDPIDLKLPENATFHTRQYLKDKTRKDALSSFFEQLVAQDVQKSVNAAMSSEEAAISYLSGHLVEDACAALLDGSDFRLATIMPLIGGDRSVRADVTKQLSEWRTSGVLAEIPLAVRALYELLAGNTNLSEGIAAPMEDVTPSFYIGEKFGLDWRRTFALRLWYEIYEDQSLEEAVRRYEKDFRAGNGKNVQRPVPWYIEPNSELPHIPRRPDQGTENAFDLLWGLLKLYSEEHCNLEEVLSPGNYNPMPMDYRMAWLLRMTLSEKQIRDFTVGYDGVNGEDLENTIAEQLSVDFATQLEAEGQWEWALFVLMFLNDADSREIGIRNILGRHVAELDRDNKKQEFVLKRLNIPSTWVDEARALLARNLHNYFTEVDHLFAASAWNEAHRSIIRHVAPSCVISEDLGKLYEVLGKFSSVDVVSEWSIGGQVYLDFINLQAVVNKSASFTPRVPPKTKGLPRNNSHIDVAKRLLDALPKMETKEFAQYVSISEIAKTISSFVLKNKDLQSDAEKILNLPLNDDQYLRKTLMLSYNQVTTNMGVLV